MLHQNQYFISRNALEQFRLRYMLYTRVFCSIMFLSFIIAAVFIYSGEYLIEIISIPEEIYDSKRNKTLLYKQFSYPLWVPFDVSLEGYYFLRLVCSLYFRTSILMMFLGKCLYCCYCF